MRAPRSFPVLLCSILLFPLVSFAADYVALDSQLDVLQKKYAAKEIDREAVLQEVRARLRQLPQKDANLSLLLQDLSTAQTKEGLDLMALRDRLLTLAFLQQRTFTAEPVNQQRMDQILQRREFITEEQSGLWDYIVAKIVNWIRSLLNWFPVGDQLIFVSRLIMTIALAGLTTLILYVIVKYTRGAPANTQLSPVIVNRKALLERPAYYVGLAEQALTHRDFRLACRHYFYAILSCLHYTGRISYQPSRTNWEYWRSLRNKAGYTSESENFEQSVRAYEKFWYGNADIDPAAPDSFRKTAEFFLEKFV